MKKYQKLLVKLLILLILPITIITSNPIKTKAHDAYFIQVLLDPATMTFQSSVEHDNLSGWKSFNNALETGHRESQFGDYTKLKTSSSLTVGAYGDAETNKNQGGMAEVYNPYMVFTFPSAMERQSFLGVKFLIRNHATGNDSERAQKISYELTNNLNQVISALFGGNPASSVEELNIAVSAILKATGSGKPTSASNSPSTSNYGDWTLKGVGDNLVITHKNGEKLEFKSRMVKGYITDTLEDGRKSPVYAEFYDKSQDVEYITMGMLGAQGLHLNEIHGHTVVDSPGNMNQSTIVKKFAELLSAIVLSIRNVLGLKSLDHMIFDTSGAGTYGGIMSYAWFKVATTFHLVFQAIAFSLLTISIVKILIQNNFATINVYSRISMMESIKKLILTAALLVSSILIVNILARLNTQFVSIFATMRGEKNLVDNLSSAHSSIGQVIMSFYYLIVTIYFNFVYIMRGITVAILIATAPLFIISIPFATADSKLFMTWTKELISNVFLQSFHAFVFALILSMSASSAGIEMAVVSFSLIPLSSFFRNLITGGDTLSSRMQDGAGSGALKAGAGIASGLMLASRFKGAKGGGKGGEKGGEGSFKGLNMEKSMGGEGEAGDVDYSGNASASQSSMDSMNLTTRDKLGANMNSAHNTVSNDYHALSGKDPMGTDKASVKARNIERAKAAGIVGAKTLGAGALGVAGVGVGMGLAMSGVSPTSAAMIGTGMIGKGAGLGKSAIDGGLDMGKAGFNDFNESQLTRNAVNDGTVVNHEALQNGNHVIERDRAKLYDMEGVVSAEDTEEGNIAITYDQKMFKEGSPQASNVGYTNEMYDDNKDWFRRRGISNVTRDGQNPDLVTIHYNKDGKRELGVNSMTTTERRIKETKRPSDHKTTQFTYNPKDVVVPKRNDEES